MARFQYRWVIPDPFGLNEARSDQILATDRDYIRRFYSRGRQKGQLNTQKFVARRYSRENNRVMLFKLWSADNEFMMRLQLGIALNLESKSCDLINQWTVCPRRCMRKSSVVLWPSRRMKIRISSLYDWGSSLLVAVNKVIFIFFHLESTGFSVLPNWIARAYKLSANSMQISKSGSWD